MLWTWLPSANGTSRERSLSAPDSLTSFNISDEIVQRRMDGFECVKPKLCCLLARVKATQWLIYNRLSVPSAWQSAWVFLHQFFFSFAKLNILSCDFFQNYSALACMCQHHRIILSSDFQQPCTNSHIFLQYLAQCELVYFLCSFPYACFACRGLVMEAVLIHSWAPEGETRVLFVLL